MADLDFEKAKENIAAITDIVNTVPVGLQQRCFELLFELAFSGTPQKGKPTEVAEHEVDKRDGQQDNDGDKAPASKRLAGNVIAFCRRQNISDAELGKLFMIEQDPLLPVYKIPSGNIAKGQLIKVLMVLLENALFKNSFTANYKELRESAREDGLFDGNFAKTFKKNADLFKGAALKDGLNDDTVIELSGQGMERLGEVVKELAQ